MKSIAEDTTYKNVRGMTHIVSFSGGKDSTAMLLMMIERGMPIDKVIQVDTTKEFPDMYRHIEKVRRMIEPLEITTVIVDFDYYFKDHPVKRGKSRNASGYGWPDFKNRWCTGLKIDAIKKEVNKYTYPIEYHGIAFDERQRVRIGDKKRHFRYPLVDWEMTELDALRYCYKRGLSWNGLYQRFDRVSCWCCALQKIGELRNLYVYYPELWKKLQEMDTHAFNRLKNKYTVEGLSSRFEKECRYLLKRRKE